MQQHGLRILPGWPAHSPDLNPQENVWSWVNDDLRKSERKADTFSVFKRRILQSTHRYPNKAALVPGLCSRMSKCTQKKGYNIRK